MKESISTLLHAAARAHPGATFIEAADGRKYTYQDAVAASARIANYLANCGVEPGDRVAVQVEKSAEGVFLYLGALRAGAVYLPLNTAYTDHELDYFVSDAGPRVVVCSPERRAGVETIAKPHGARVETMDAKGMGSIVEGSKGLAESFDDAERSQDDLAAILYTSGTTGRAKGAMLTQRNLRSNAVTLAKLWRFTRDDVLIHALPIFHTHGLFVALNVTLAAGSSVILLPKFDAALIVRLFGRATVMMGVPTFYTRLLDQPELGREATRGMRLFVSGSAPLSAETHTTWSARTGHAILERYGMTETNMNASNPYDGKRKPGAVGFALEGVEIRVADPESGKALAPGEVGAIEVRGPNVFKGYWKNPGKTAAEFRPDGFFITGDVGRFDEEGYLHIVGRAKDLIITGGYNVYPAEVEGEIDALDGVAECAVVGLPDRDFGESVNAIVVRAKGSRVKSADIMAALGSQLARYKQPKRIFFVPALPRNAMGKIQKNVLREKLGPGGDPAALGVESDG
jgi:malonyl-CoA/methylmalonyl-CoA synthetase